MFIFFAMFVLTLLLLKHSLGGVSPLPPGPNLWQLLRNIRLLAKNPHVAMTNLAKIYGPLISFRVGGKTIVVASSTSAARKILKSQVFTGRHFPVAFYNVSASTNLSVMAAKECDVDWKSLLQIERDQILSPRAVELDSTNRSNRIQEMMSYLRAKEGHIVIIDEVVLQTFVNISGNFLASTNLMGFDIMGRIDENYVHFIEKVNQQFSRVGLADLLPCSETRRHVDFWSKRGSASLLENIRRIWGNIIHERRVVNHRDNPKDLLDVLLADEHSYSDDQIGFLLTELLLSATIPTTWDIIWLLIELVKNGEMLSRVRNEIQTQAIEGGSLNESRLSECKYFNVCIKEALRCHFGGAFGIPRRATETSTVDNYVIPKDSIVMVNFRAIHSDPETGMTP